MTIIKIDYNESTEAVERVHALLEDVALRNPNWNGAKFEIQRDEFTCIPERDDADACALFYSIQSALRGE